MAIHNDFPTSPFEISDPTVRWFPGPETSRDSLDKLIAPLVNELRKRVKEWRNQGYEGASDTSKALLKWWFETEHPIHKQDGTYEMFNYYFAQREAVESVIYVMEIDQLEEQDQLKQYDVNNLITAADFEESWRRLVLKMATGTGKTKVMSLIIAWSYFHKNYEVESSLSRNFLLVAPNIIVLERLREDFDGLKIFNSDPVIPDNGFEGRNWQSDFYLDLHIQDEVSVVNEYGNLFLSNIHRVYETDNTEPSFDDDDTTDYFLGRQPSGQTIDAKVDLEKIVRNVDELLVLNDEAHHIHNKKLQWFKSIEDIHNNLIQKDKFLSLQIDLTATPKKENGVIFKQTISDYPIVEAIHQNVLKHPIVPDSATREELEERPSSNITEQWRDHINLGHLEWKKSYDEHKRLGKKAVWFVMTDDTKNCDEVGNYLEATYPELKDSVLIIHTNNNGDINDNVKGKKKDELNKLREEARLIDGWESPYKAVISVLMLKEGWDVRNVTTIVGLRSYQAKSKILPEQTLGRGLRKMYPGFIEEKVSVIGSPAFMEFVDGIKIEGVEVEERPMGPHSPPNAPLIIEVDSENPNKDMIALDIKIPILSPRIFREYRDLNELDPSAVNFQPLEYREYPDDDLMREIVFRDFITDEIDHVQELDAIGSIDYRNIIGYFARKIALESKMQGSYDILYGKIKFFIENHMFTQVVVIEDLITLRNLSEPAASVLLMNTFTKAINELTVKDRGIATINRFQSLRDTPTDPVNHQDYVIPHKSLFNKIIGDNDLERRFARYLDNCPDIVSFAKNMNKIGFSVEYVDQLGKLRKYFPDFFIKLSESEYFLAETKGREDVDVEHKMNRLKTWCQDINNQQNNVKWDFIYVDQITFDNNHFPDFDSLVRTFTRFK